MHNACNQKARGVSEKVPFASLDLLARIEPARPPSLGGFNRLAVDHSRGGTCLPAIGLTRHHDKMVVDLLPGAVVAPPVEVALHRRIGWKFLRQQPPLATGLSDKKDRIHQRPHLRHTRPAACDGDADVGEFDLFYRSDRLPVAVAAEGISTLYDGAALLLPVARRRHLAEDQPPSCHDGA